MIVSISNDELTNSVDSHTCQTIEFSFTVSILPKLFDKPSVGIENLNPVIRGVGDDDGVVRTDGNAAWPCETSGFAPPTTDLKQLLTLLEVLTSREGTCHCDTCKKSDQIKSQENNDKILLLTGCCRSCCRGSGGACHVF